MLIQFSNKFFIFNIFLSLFLAGCGGGDDNIGASNNLPSSSSASSSVSNTAPTLSGIFNLEAKAENTGLLIINAADKENDSLQVSIINKPDWLSVELKNGQVNITAKPGFFDIAEHKLALSISDGKLSREYPLSISVIDNPSKWLVQSLSSDDLLGSWEIDDGSRLYIYPNGSGSFIDRNNTFTLLKWSSDSSKNIYIEKSNQTCPNCTSAFPITALAKKSGNLRLRINSSETAVNAKKLSFTTASDGVYFNLSNFVGWNSYNEISENGKKLSLKVVTESNSYTEFGSANAIYTLIFSAQLNKIYSNSATFTVASTNPPTISLFLSNKRTNTFDPITFTIQFSTLELIPSTAKDLIAHIKYKLILADASEKINVDDYGPELNTYLTQEHEIYHESIQPTETTSPKILAGDKYYLPSATGRWNGINYANAELGSSATTVVFETSSTGYTLLEGSLFSATQKTPFTWSSTNKKLSLKFENGLPPIDYTFVLENGTLLAVNTSYSAFGPAIKADDTFSTQIPAGFYFSNPFYKNKYFIYEYMYFSATQPKGISITMAPEKTSMTYYPYKFESDGSITFLNSYCVLNDFFACEESQRTALNSSETNASLEYINYKPIAKNGDLYTFAQTRYFIANSGNTISQSIVNLTYDELGMAH